MVRFAYDIRAIYTSDSLGIIGLVIFSRYLLPMLVSLLIHHQSKNSILEINTGLICSCLHSSQCWCSFRCSHSKVKYTHRELGQLELAEDWQELSAALQQEKELEQTRKHGNQSLSLD